MSQRANPRRLGRSRIRPDLEARFIEHDLQERCTAGLGIAPSQFEVVVREGSLSLIHI